MINHVQMQEDYFLHKMLKIDDNQPTNMLYMV